MAKKYCGYKSKNGTVYDTEREAEIADIFYQRRMIKRIFEQSKRNLLRDIFFSRTNFELNYETDRIFDECIRVVLEDPKLLEKIMELYNDYTIKSVQLDKELEKKNEKISIWDLKNKKISIWNFWKEI